jgi:hypothetical protein
MENSNLPIPKLRELNKIKIRKQNEIQKEKNINDKKKYLDQLFDKEGDFLKKYFN